MTADAVGGVWTYALELADALADREIDVTLAVMGAPLGAAQRAELRRARVAGCFASDFALEWQGDWASVRRSGEWLREIAQVAKPDIVHVNGYVHAALGWDKPVVVVAHSDVLSWYAAVRKQAAPAAWDRYRREVGGGLAAADLVVAPTQAMLDDLRRHHRVDAETRVIANGVSPPPVAIADKRRIVLAAGRAWDEAKNIAALERVAGRVAVEIAEWIGRDELRARMAEAAVFCAPARYEPFGLAPLEAALAGCSLVLGDIPSLRELWDGVARFVDPDDDDALVAALNESLDEPLDARARAAELTATRMAAAYAASYARLEERGAVHA